MSTLQQLGPRLRRQDNRLGFRRFYLGYTYSFFEFWHPMKSRMIDEQWLSRHEQVMRIGSRDYKNLAPKRGPVETKGGFKPAGGIVSHHHLLVGPLIEGYFAELSRRAGEIDTLVLMAPDHSRRVEQGLLATEADFVWQGRRLATDRQTARMWQRELGFDRDDWRPRYC